MELDDVICKRRSIRKFSNNPVEKNKIREIIEAGVQAPSACNFQAWKFRILTDKEKEKVVNLGGADFIKDSPTAILVVYHISNEVYYAHIQSASACIQNMILKATDIGLGSCWVSHLPSKKILKRLLKIPSQYEIIACVVFGYPTNKSKIIKRKQDYDNLFVFEKKPKSFRNFLKYFYIRQPFRPKFIEKKFTLRFED